jgi:hypothetical protein
MIRALTRVCGMLLVIGACAHQGGGRGGPPPTHEELLKEVRDSYKIDQEISARNENDAKIDETGAVEGLEVSTVKLNKKFLKFPDHDWVAAIRANKPYPRLNLGVGLNYIIRIEHPTDGAHAFAVVPEDLSLKPRYLLYASLADLAHGNPRQPLVIRKQVPSTQKTEAFVIGGCLECSMGHCSTMDYGDFYLQ